MKITAQVLAVLQSENDSIAIGLTIEGKNDEMAKSVDEYVNLTLHFEEDAARLAGFPREWTLHEDFEVEDESVEVPIDYGKVHITAENEKEILRQLKVSLRWQFKDPIFKDHLSDSQKEAALLKIDKAVSELINI